MIIFVEGKLGAGKTYYAVNQILRKYYVYDKKWAEYTERKEHVLLTNIDGLKIPHIDLKEEIEKHGLENVFSEQYFMNIRQGKLIPVLVIVDETQLKLDRKFYSKEVFGLFQLSRHYGLDMILITQDSFSVAREVRELEEYTIKSVRRSLTLGASFAYHKVIDGEIFKKFRVPKKQEVFKLYKSFTFEEGDKPRSVFYRYVLMIVSLTIVAVVVFKFGFIDTFFKGNTQKKKPQVVATSANLFESQQKTKNKNINIVEYKNLHTFSYKKPVEEKSVSDLKPEKVIVVAQNEIKERCILQGTVQTEGFLKTIQDCGDYQKITINGVEEIKYKSARRQVSALNLEQAHAGAKR